MRDVRYETHGKPDDLGRQLITAYWEEPDGVFRAEMGSDGQPVGYKRAQVFFTTLEDVRRTFERSLT